MKTRSMAILACLSAVALVAGCATTKVGQRQSAAGQALPRPARVLVYDFAATPDEIDPGSPIAGQYELRKTAQTAEDARLGHELASQLTAALVDELSSRRIPAVRAALAGPPRANDYLIKGQLISIDEGSRTKRVLIGFGAGASKLESLVQVYLMTDAGPRRVSELELKSEGSKMPGMLVPVGAGAAAGRAATSAIVSGGLSGARELGGAPIDERAKATAKTLAERIEEAYKKRGWM